MIRHHVVVRALVQGSGISSKYQCTGSAVPVTGAVRRSTRVLSPLHRIHVVITDKNHPFTSQQGLV